MAKAVRAIDLEIAAELNPEVPTVDLEARRRKIEEDYRWAQMRADAEALQRQMDEDYNRVKHLLWVVEKPFILFSNFVDWLLEFKLDPFQEKPRRRKVWVALGFCSWFFTLLFGKDLKLNDDNKSIPMIGLHWIYALSILFGYPFVLFCLYNIRDPLHYVLRRSHKQLLEWALVLLSSSWVYYTTDDDTLDLSITGPLLCLDLIPCFNLWWNFDDNFGFLDSCLFILIEAALLFCRHRGLVVLMAVTVVGLALQFIKNAYTEIAELNPEAPVDLEARRRKIEEDYIRAEMIRVELEARLRKIKEDYNIQVETRVGLESEQIAELKIAVDLLRKIAEDLEDYRWAQMRADHEARQMQMEEHYNLVKHLLWVVEKPFIVVYNFWENITNGPVRMSFSVSSPVFSKVIRVGPFAQESDALLSRAAKSSPVFSKVITNGPVRM